MEAKKFTDFLALYPNSNGKCGKEKWALEPLPTKKEEEPSEKGAVVFASIPELSLKELGGKRASKELVGETPYEAFIYGEKMHRLLELSDFATKDVSWIQDQKDREKIEKVLALPLFENAKDAKVFHEYRFYDDESGHEGSIDLLLVYEDHIDLVDYKSGDIEDEAYPKQLATYEKHLKKVFKQPIKKYLLSIRECRIKGVD
jgi:ATP-dependent exoDNAse (exonuclease V) beta subunit